MSLNVLNKRFLSLLRCLDVDIDVSSDTTFDGLFERGQNDLNYFLEWFVDNITVENALTESEADIYQYLKVSNLCLTEEELNIALMKCIPSYEDLKLLDENHIENCLTDELEEINGEYQKLVSIKLDLDRIYEDLKKKPNQLREECNKKKKKLGEVKSELQTLNIQLNVMNKEISNLKSESLCDFLDLSRFRKSCQEEEKLIERFNLKNFTSEQTMPLASAQLDEMIKLKMNLATAEFCSVASRSLVEEMKFKTLKAGEFLSKLKNESETHFTFEEVLSVWCDANEMNGYDNLMEEADSLQLKELKEHLNRKCELILHHFLSDNYCHKLDENNAKVTKFAEFVRHMKSDTVVNLLLQQVCNKWREKEKEFADAVNQLNSSLNRKQSDIRNALDTIACRNYQSRDYLRNVNEKHALLVSARKVFPENSCSFNKNWDAVTLLLEHPSFYPAEFFDQLEKEIFLNKSNVMNGPTNQLQMTPIGIQWELSNCDRIIAENSHSIQRILTEYINTKKAISEVNRSQSLLWIDFLIRPDYLVSKLEELQKKSLSCSSIIGQKKIK